MTAEELSRYQTALETQLAELTEASQVREEILDEGGTSRDFVGPDRAADLGSQEVDASLAESERNLALKIFHALERIERGTYGLCEGCGLTIPTARLDAKPSVSLCLKCQEEHEAGR